MIHPGWTQSTGIKPLLKLGFQFKERIIVPIIGDYLF